MENSKAAGIVNKSLKQRRYRSMDMRFYWVRDRINQRQFIVYWQPGVENKGDYNTKHHPATYHKSERYKYLQPTADGRKYGNGLSP